MKTEELKVVLNGIKPLKWKRKSKIKDKAIGTIRVFTAGKDHVAVIGTGHNDDKIISLTVDGVKVDAPPVEVIWYYRPFDLGGEMCIAFVRKKYFDKEGYLNDDFDNELQKLLNNINGNTEPIESVKSFFNHEYVLEVLSKHPKFELNNNLPEF